METRCRRWTSCGAYWYIGWIGDEKRRIRDEAERNGALGEERGGAGIRSVGYWDGGSAFI